jgi:predicted pyridoxine 5'-phosphate oxidase superfamily flavin-nucleotide-binding protein
MAKMPKEVMDMFNDPAASKVLGTIDETGVLNVAPLGTLRAVNEETIVFADIYGGKTKKNLEKTKKAASVAFKYPPPVGYQIKGTFVGWQTSGQLFDMLDKRMKEILKIGIKRVGTIKVEEVFSMGMPEPGKKIV